MTSPEGGLANSHLPLIGIADDIPCLRRLGYLAQILVGVPLVDLPHVACLMFGGGIVVEWHKGAEGIGIVGDEHRTVSRGFLADNEIGASHRCTGSHQHRAKNQIFFHTNK